MILDNYADTRTGDKGDTLILAVLPHDDDSYAYLERVLTCDVVTAHFAPLVTGPVQRRELPQLPGFVFTLPGVLGAGVTASQGLDGHGKCLSSYALMLELPESPTNT